MNIGSVEIKPLVLPFQCDGPGSLEENLGKLIDVRKTDNQVNYVNVEIQVRDPCKKVTKDGICSDVGVPCNFYVKGEKVDKVDKDNDGDPDEDLDADGKLDDGDD
jgi:hypothetical protein